MNEQLEREIEDITTIDELEQKITPESSAGFLDRSKQLKVRS